MIQLPEPECLEHMRVVVRYARQVGLLPQLVGALRWLNNYANGPGCHYDRATGANTRCLLYPDRHAPRSFEYVMQCRENEQAPWKKFFPGGLTYQGPDSPADGSAPSFTVSLAEGVGWFSHT